MKSRNYIPDCISASISNAQEEQAYQEYGLQRAKFNIFMITLYCIFFVVLSVHWMHIFRSPSQRKSMDWYSHTGLLLFLIVDVLAIWNSATMI
jgi:hypothetical protein